MRIFSFIALIFLGSCLPQEQPEFETPFIEKELREGPFLEGNSEYLQSPFTTASSRIYMVGHQDGSFPELGWHIKGEMGGIWDHPVKLMDGFTIELIIKRDTIALDNAQKFTNYPMANCHSYDLAAYNIRATRCQFVPDDKEGIVVQLAIENTGDGPQELQVRFTGHADLRPTWLGERTNMTDTKDDAAFKDDNYWMAKDSLNPWYVIFGNYRSPVSHYKANTNYQGKGVAAALVYELSIEAGQSSSLDFIIAGSYQSESAVVATYNGLKSNWAAYLENKTDRYENLANQTRLTVPDKKIEAAFEWLKYNCDWLVRTVPEVGTGIMAGIPDYPWWFGVDSEYALKGYMAIGQEAAVLETIALLDSISNAVNGNGRIVHEVSTNGAVFNEGNINETPQFASLIWEVFRWNGDRAFLEKYFPTVEQGLEWLMDTKDSNGNGFPEGFGMMEIHGLDSEMIDVAAYTQRAFADAAKMAEVLEKKELAKEYQSKAQALAEAINEQFWSADFDSYADFIGTDEQALHLIEDAIVRADTLNKPWAVEELEQTKAYIQANPSAEARPFVMHHNWVVNTPMEMNIADSSRAITALQTARKFVNPFGVFVTGIDRDESAGKEDGSFKGSKVFSYTGAVMTLPTGVQIVAENNYSRPDTALDYLQRMTRSFSYAFPGSMYEVSPDYGMMTQAWNIYSYAVPIVQQFFGVQPYAHERKIVLRPTMPNAWDEGSLENVKVGDNLISVFYSRTGNEVSFRVEQESDWQLVILLDPDETTSVQVEGGTKEENGAMLKVLSTAKTVSASYILNK
jgi:glycogen debranching enzyme